MVLGGPVWHRRTRARGRPLVARRSSNSGAPVWNAAGDRPPAMQNGGYRLSSIAQRKLQRVNRKRRLFPPDPCRLCCSIASRIICSVIMSAGSPDHGLSPGQCRAAAARRPGPCPGPAGWGHARPVLRCPSGDPFLPGRFVVPWSLHVQAAVDRAPPGRTGRRRRPAGRAGQAGRGPAVARSGPRRPCCGDCAGRPGSGQAGEPVHHRRRTGAAPRRRRRIPHP